MVGEVWMERGLYLFHGLHEPHIFEWKSGELCLYIVGRVANAANIAIVIRVKIDVYQEQRTVVHFQR